MVPDHARRGIYDGRMDELSPLFHDIEFNERFRGYDVDEVDAYVDRVAKAAALVQGRIAELQDRVAAAESRPASAGSATEAGESADDGELGRVLLLAQRTADAAIEEANAEASTIREQASADAEQVRREADDHASLVLAEAETDRRRMVAEAEAAAESAASQERDRLAAEVAELERYRSFLGDDISILEEHLADARLSLAASVSALTDLIDRPESFRTTAMPATSGVEAPAVLATLTEAPADAVEEVEPEIEVETSDLAEELAPAEPIAAEVSESLDVDDALTFTPAEMPDELSIEPEPTQPIEVVEAAAPAEPSFEAEVETEPEIELVAEIEPVAEPEPVTEPEPSAVEEPEVVAEAAMPVEEVVEAAPPVIDDEPVAEADEAVGDDVFAPHFAEADPMPDEPEPAPAVYDVEAEAEPVDLTPEPGTLADAPVADGAPMALDLDLTQPIVSEAPVVDLTEPEVAVDEPAGGPNEPMRPEAFAAPIPTDRPDETLPTTIMERPRLVTTEDLENGDAGWIEDLRSVGPVTEPTPAIDDSFLFGDPEPVANDDFLDQLRDAVSGDPTDEFGEDALAAFFDDGEDDGGRNWFNRRR